MNYPSYRKTIQDNNYGNKVFIPTDSTRIFGLGCHGKWADHSKPKCFCKGLGSIYKLRFADGNSPGRVRRAGGFLHEHKRRKLDGPYGLAGNGYTVQLVWRIL